MVEVWKDIEGYEGLYQVSNTGKVKSFRGRNGAIDKEGHILKANLCRGYPNVGLCKGDGTRKTFLVHRLVAAAFVPNPNGYKEINHKDENKLNGNASNLEWCTRDYNMAYGTARLRQGVSRGQPVEQFTLDGIKIATYCSAEIAGTINRVDASSIHKCCKHQRKYVGGYQWRYSE